MDTALKYLGIGAILYFLLSKFGGDVAARLSFRRPKVEFGGFSGSGVTLRVMLPVVNANPIPIPVDRFQGVVKYGSEVIAHLSAISPFMVKPNSELTVPVTAQIDFNQVSSAVANILQSQQYLSELSLEGVVTSGALSYPVNLRMV